MNKHIIFAFLMSVALTLPALAQKPDKAFEDIVAGVKAKERQPDVDNNMNKARATLEKVLAKDANNAMANLGMAVILSYDAYSQKDYFRGWHYFKKADAGVSTLTPDDKKVLDTYFMAQKLERRGKPIDKNMEIERNLVEEKLIKFVREENNLQYAEKFLEEFPDSKYYNNVVHIRNYIEFRKAENAGTVDAFNYFLNKYPDAAQTIIAKEERNALAYKQTVEANTFAAYKNFVDNYPDAVQYEEAKKKLGILAFDDAAQKHTLEAIEQFMEQFPNSPKMPEAKLMKRQLLFDWAKSVNSIEAYNKFVSQYPEGEMFVDIFNLKSAALGQSIAADLPMENYKVIRGFDNKQARDFGGSIATFADGSLMVIANTPSLSDDMDDVWMIKLDTEGKMQKNDILGNDFDDRVSTAYIDNAGSLYAAGLTNAIKNTVPGQSWFFKMNPQGKNEINAKFEGNEVLSMVVYADGKSLLGGYVQEGDTALPTPLITKLNAQGRKLWTRTYAPGKKVTSLALDVTSNLCSMAFNDSWVAQIDELGYIKWDNMLEGCKLSAAAIANGKTVYTGTKDSKGYAAAFDAAGKKLWEVQFDTPSDGSFEESRILPDGSVVSGGTFGNAMVLVKIDASGKVVFAKTFDGSKTISFNGLATTADNSVWVSATYNDADIVVFKLGL
jgi:outer membrane protein assembly factor BamD (BamD/ComL family)